MYTVSWYELVLDYADQQLNYNYTSIILLLVLTWKSKTDEYDKLVFKL